MKKYLLGLIALFLCLFAVDAVPQLRGGWGWQWDYKPADLDKLLILVFLVALYLAGVWLTRRYGRGLLLWAVVGSVFLSIGVVNLRGEPGYLLFTRTVSPVYTGSSAVAVRNMGVEGGASALKRWTTLMAELADSANIHTALSPPGQPLIHYWAANQPDFVAKPISDLLRPYQCSDVEIMSYTRGEMTSAALGMLMPLWAALVVFPLYLVGVHLVGDKTKAAQTAQWWALIPSVLIFAPSWNTLYPLLITGSFALLTRALDHNQMRYSLLAGALMSVATFLNFSVVPALLLMGLYTLGYWYSAARQGDFPPLPFWWAVKVGLWFGAGLSLCWLVFWLYTGFTPLDILHTAFDQHLSIERNYWVWLGLHLYDLFLFAGWALVFPALIVGWQTAKNWRGGLTRLGVLALSLWLTLLILVISNSARGETARVWIFFVPFLILVSIHWLHDWRFLCAQAATLLVIVGVINAMPTFLNPPPMQPRQDFPSMDSLTQLPLNVTFRSDDYDGEFMLEGYRFVPDPAQQVITFELTWRGIQPTERPYQFELIATAENKIDGKITAEPYRWYPQNGNYLTSCWQKGQVIREVLVMPLPPVSMPVTWELQLHAQDVRTGETLPELILGTVPYP